MKKIFDSFWLTVLLTTLIAGINDIVLAYTLVTISSGQLPTKMLLYMAGGALGIERAMAGGFWTGALGLLFHFIISFAFTLFVFLIFPWLKLQKSDRKWLILFSCIHAVFANLWMKYVVLPLTKLPPQRPFTWEETWPGWPLFALVFSFPICWAAWKYYRIRDGVK